MQHEDGMLYAEVASIDSTHSTTKPAIIRMESDTQYSTVDFSIQPQPSGDSDSDSD
jgi:hypothetical protein